MKSEISSMDLLALMQELKVLEGSRVDKFYQRGNELVMYAYKPGDKKYRLFLSPGKAFLTDYKREMPQEPPAFCMYLRKQLGGKKIERVEMYDFDRILEIHTDEDVLICELFRDGNFLHTNKNRDVKNAMRAGAVAGREIHRGDQYPYPEDATDPREVGLDFLAERPERDIVRLLASDVGLGGAWAEEICARAGVEKETPICDLEDAEQENVITTLRRVLQKLEDGPLEPVVYSDADGPVAAAPIDFVTYEEYPETETYDSWSTALDSYFTEKEKADYKRRKRKKYRKKKAELEHRKEQQEGMLEGMRGAIDENREIGDLIYENYSLVEDILDSIKQAKEQYSESEIMDRLSGEQAQGVPEAEAIEELNLHNNQVVVDIGERISLDLGLGVEKNAEQYYQKSKQAKKKVKGAEKALKKTKRELAKLKKNDVDVDSAFKNKREEKEKKQWYEKFRWCFSSDGFLIIGGRDTTTNDMIVKKYMDPQDTYVHADFTGAPSVVIKNEDDEDIPEATLKEAGMLAVSFARAWKAGLTAETAYWVEPDQVTQEPESGEYLPKGSFVIRGDREYMRNLPVNAAVGAFERDGRVVAMGGPVDAVKANCEHYAVIEQGDEKPSDTAKSIQHHLHTATDEDFDLDRIIRALPPGKARIKERY